MSATNDSELRPWLAANFLRDLLFVVDRARTGQGLDGFQCPAYLMMPDIALNAARKWLQGPEYELAVLAIKCWDYGVALPATLRDSIQETIIQLEVEAEGVIANKIIQAGASERGAEAEKAVRAAEPIDGTPNAHIGFLGGQELADALGIHPTRRAAFFRQLERWRLRLGDENWDELKDRRHKGPRFRYRVDSPQLQALAARYREPQPD